MSDQRCTVRTHVIEKGNSFCDCGALMVGMTVAKNARVVTLLDVLQRSGLATWGRRDAGEKNR